MVKASRPTTTEKVCYIANAVGRVRGFDGIQTGDVKAMVGGYDFATASSTTRPSRAENRLAFKPFILLRLSRTVSHQTRS